VIQKFSVIEIPNFDKMLQSYSQMLGIAKKPLRKLENEIKRPFLMKKIRKFFSDPQNS